MKVDIQLLEKLTLTNLAKHGSIMESQKRKLSILFFIWTALLFFVNLNYHFLDNFNILIFWLSILIMVGTIIYQILFLKNNTFILFEIFIVYLFLHLVYQIGYYGLRGSDTYVDYNLLKTILYTHHFSLGNDVSGWPMIHLFFSAITLISKITPLLIAKYLASFISSIIVLPIYLLSYAIYKEKKIALFSCLFFGFIPQFVNFDALFVRETFGIFIMVFFIYILYISKRKNDVRYTGLLLILIPVIVFSHHFSSMIILIFLGGYFIISLGIPYIYRNLIKKKIEFSDIIDIKIISLMVFISVITYWFFLAGGSWAHMFIIQNIDSIIAPSNSSTYSQVAGLGTPIATLNGKIIFYGFFSFHLLFSLILLINLIIIKKNVKRIWDYSFSIVFYFCMGYAFLATYVLPSGMGISPDRLLSFGWIFGTIPLIGLFLYIRKKMLKKILILICICFIVFNLYNIDSGYYTGNAISNGDLATEKEYLIAGKINFTQGHYGYNIVLSVIYNVQGINPREAFSLNNIHDFQKSPSLAVINDLSLLSVRENTKIKSKVQYDKINEILSYKNNKDIDKIYDIGNIYVLRGGG